MIRHRTGMLPQPIFSEIHHREKACERKLSWKEGCRRLSRKIMIWSVSWLVTATALCAGPPPTHVGSLMFGASKDEVRQRALKNPVPKASGGRVEVSSKLENKGEFYRVGSTTFPLFRVKGEYAVRYKPGVDGKSAEQALRSALPAAQAIAKCKPKNIEVIDVGEEASQNSASLIGKTTVVERVFPVYAYPGDGARMIPTDDIILCTESESAINALRPQLAALGLELGERLPLPNIVAWHVRLLPAAQETALSVCEKLAALPGVKWAEPDFVRELYFDFVPNDPLFSKQQGLHNTGQNGAVSDADVDAPEGWDVSVGSSSVVIAIIDDGVDTTHPDLLIAPGGYDFYNNDNDPSPVGTDGHGTGCAGVAAAIINNGYRIAGIAGGCKILPIKIAEGSSFASNTVIGNAIKYAADRADVLSCSWGGGSPSGYINNAIDYAITNGRGGKGSPVFFASGNSASGWYRGGSRYRLSTSGLSGSYYIAFVYEKDASGAAGLDTVYIDNVCLLQSDGYTQLWKEDFEGATFPPSGWTLQSSTGSNLWYRTSTNAYKATGGSYSPRAGAIGDNQWTALITPLLTFTGNETLCFAAYISTESEKDLFWIDVYTSSGSYVGSWGPFSGVPSISTAVSYPASYANSIAVGAASDCDKRADYSQYGPELDFVAPSNGGWNDVATLDPSGSIGWTGDDYKMNFGGTSSACPLAAGIGALRLSYNPSETAASLRSWMHAHCDKIGGVTYSGGEAGAGGRNDEYGYGRINLFLTVPVRLSSYSVE